MAELTNDVYVNCQNCSSPEIHPIAASIKVMDPPVTVEMGKDGITIPAGEQPGENRVQMHLTCAKCSKSSFIQIVYEDGRVQVRVQKDSDAIGEPPPVATPQQGRKR